MEGQFGKEVLMAQYEINLDDARNLVVVHIYGDIPVEEGEDIITNARLKAADLGYSILYDVRRAKTLATLSQWFFLPRKLEVFKRLKTRTIRVAILVTPEDAEDYRFYELVAGNVGLDVQILHTEEDVEAWLKKK